MEESVTISLAKYENFLRLEEAVKKRKSLVYYRHSSIYYMIDSKETTLLFNRISELEKDLANVLDKQYDKLKEEVKTKFTCKFWK